MLRPEIVACFSKQIWRAFVKLSAGEYLRVNSRHQREARRVDQLLRRHGLRIEGLDYLDE